MTSDVIHFLTGCDTIHESLSLHHLQPSSPPTSVHPLPYNGTSSSACGEGLGSGEFDVPENCTPPLEFCSCVHVIHMSVIKEFGCSVHGVLFFKMSFRSHVNITCEPHFIIMLSHVLRLYDQQNIFSWSACFCINNIIACS